MAGKKKNKEKKSQNSLPEKINKIVKDLYYISETDAEISIFVGKKADSVDKETLLAQIGQSESSPVEERGFDDFFSRLTQTQDWFGDEEKESARKFLQLKELLQENLKDLKIFKVGEIELDIYVVGLDLENVLMGIQTKAVET